MEREEQLLLLREERDRCLRAEAAALGAAEDRQRAALRAAGGFRGDRPTPPQDADTPPVGNLGPAAAAPRPAHGGVRKASPGSGPSEWWICHRCKSRAYASREEALDHEAKCEGGAGGSSGPPPPRRAPVGAREPESLSLPLAHAEQVRMCSPGPAVARAVQKARLRVAAALRDEPSPPTTTPNSGGYRQFLAAASRGYNDQQRRRQDPRDEDFRRPSQELMRSRPGAGLPLIPSQESLGPRPSGMEMGMGMPPVPSHQYLAPRQPGDCTTPLSQQEMLRRSAVLGSLKEQAAASAAALERQYAQLVRAQAEAQHKFENFNASAAGPVASARNSFPPHLPFPVQRQRQQQQQQPEGSVEMEEFDKQGKPLYTALPEPVMLSMPTDKDWITPLHCFVRRHCVQIFTATPEDVAMPSKGKRRPIFVGQVGIRCPHCHAPDKKSAAGKDGEDNDGSKDEGECGDKDDSSQPDGDRVSSPEQQAAAQASTPSAVASSPSDHTQAPERGSVYYPFTISSIYNASMNLLQRHLQACPHVPRWIMDRYLELKADDARSGTSKRYWIDAAASMGLVDTPKGIRVTTRRPLPPLPSLTGQRNKSLPDGADPRMMQGGQRGSWTSGTFRVQEPESFARRNSNDFYSNRSNALPMGAQRQAQKQEQQPAISLSVPGTAGEEGKNSSNESSDRSRNPNQGSASVRKMDEVTSSPERQQPSSSRDTETGEKAHPNKPADSACSDQQQPEENPANASENVSTSVPTKCNPEKALAALPVGPSLVSPEDTHLATTFSYHLMAQMQLCTFTEADRLGKRKALPIGFAGLACRHCYGGYGTGRFFPSTIKTLSDTSKTLNVLYNHMLRCRKCPADIRASLEVLRGRHDGERSRMKFGSQKAFFGRIWSRLHGSGPAAPARPSAELTKGAMAVSPLVALANLAGMKRKDPPGMAGGCGVGSDSAAGGGVGDAGLVGPQNFGTQGQLKSMPPMMPAAGNVDATRQALQKQLEFYVPRNPAHKRTKYHFT